MRPTITEEVHDVMASGPATGPGRSTVAREQYTRLGLSYLD